MTRKKYQILRRAYRSIMKYDGDHYEREMSAEVQAMRVFSPHKADRLHLTNPGLYLSASREALLWMRDRGYSIAGPKEKLP